MTLGIMQPYFFPYLGYFNLIASCNQFIVFDVSQYTTRTWMNRNRILKPYPNTEVWQYLTIAVEKSSQKTPINEITIKDKAKSHKEILRQIEHYKKHAPFYNEVQNIITGCFENTKSDFLAELNVQSLKSVCRYLEIDFNPIILSEENINLPEIEYAGQWALEVSTYYKANKYLNPPAGKSIFKEEEFKNRGIELCFMDMPSLTYNCSPYIFEKNLSILDVLMWNSKETLQSYLNF